MRNRFVLYGLILLSGFFIAVGFVLLNTSLKFLFWPLIIGFGLIFLKSVDRVIKKQYVYP